MLPFIDDGVLIETAAWCDAPLRDVTGGELLYINSGDYPVAGTKFYRYRSTGIIDSQSKGYDLGVYTTPKGAIEADYQNYNLPELPGDPYPGDYPIPSPLPDPTPIPVPTYYRKRYTANVPLTDSMPAIDFLHNILFPSSKLYMLWSGQGKLQIKCEKPEDSCRMRASSTYDATTITIDDVTPWLSSLRGRLLIGAHTTTSEVRDVISAAYSGATLSITASGSGGVTAVASGFSGTPPVSIITIGGTPTGTVTVTIDDRTLTYDLDGYSTIDITAALIAEIINADFALRKYITASASGDTVLLTSRIGVLTLSSPLVNPHRAAMTQPTTAPVLTSAAGSLSAGYYYVARTYVRDGFETSPSEISVITIADDESITVGAITPPAGSTVNTYISVSPGSVQLGLINSNNGASFSINSYPEDGAQELPQEDETAEECVRIAMSFASNNQDIYPLWQASKALTLNTVILPTSPNGRKYKVTTAGTTGTTEPTWPTTHNGTVTNGSVVFTEFGATILGQAGLTRANIYKDTIRWPLQGRQQSYNQFKGKYREAKDDFALTPIEVNDYAHQKRTNKITSLEIDLAAVDNHDQASRLLNSANAKYRDGDYHVSHKTGPKAIVLEEGDVYCVSDASGGFVNFLLRAEELQIDEQWDVSSIGRKYTSQMYADRARAHTIKMPTVLRFTATVDTLFVPLDIPIWREADASLGAGIYVPVNRPVDEGDWRGSYIYSDASGAYVAISGKIQNQTPIGGALTTLSSTTNVFTLDTTSTGRVQITSLGQLGVTYPLESTTDTKMGNGANLAAWGAPGRWELVQFKTATLYATDTYDLSGFLRGRHGTENNTSNHEADDAFVLLTDADGNDLGTQYIPLDFSLLNREVNLKAVTVNQDVADASPISFTWEGYSRKPLAPIIEPGERDSADNLLISLTFRTRIGGGLRDNQGGPTAEETLEGRVEIYDGSTLKRTLPVIGGMAQAAALVTYASGDVDKFDHIDVNTLSVSGTDVSINARSLQDIWETGNFVEATLVATGEGAATLRLIDKNTLESRYQIFCNGGLISGIYVNDGGTNIFVGDYASGDEVRLMIRLVGSEARFYINYTGTSTPPVYISPIAPSFPMTPACNAAVGSGGSAQIMKMILTTNPYVKTIYSAAQQEEDFGSVQSTPLSVKVRAAQYSKLVGWGQSSERYL